MSEAESADRPWDVYQITCLVSDKLYVGITAAGIHRRWKGHVDKSREGKNGPLHAAIRKYGKNSFMIEVVYVACCVREAHAVERALIAERRTLAPFGYNLSLGGEGQTMTPETKRKLSVAHTGKRASPETIAKIRASHAGKRPAELTLKRAMDAIKGVPLTEKHRAALRDAWQRRKTKRPKEIRSQLVVAATRLRKALSGEISGIQRHGRKWRCCILVSGKQRTLGAFETEDLARAAYIEAALQAFLSARDHHPGVPVGVAGCPPCALALREIPATGAGA